MPKKIIYLLSLLVAAGLILAIVLVANRTSRSITVGGQSSLQVAPDRARITLGVEADGATASAARQAMAAAMTKIAESLRQLGLREQDLKTVEVSLIPVREYNDGRERLRGYRAANRLEVTLNNLDQVGAVTDAAVAAGANGVNDLRYYREDLAAVRAQALAQAVADARIRAEAAAKAAGLKLGAVAELTEGAAGTSAPVPMFQQAEMKGAAQTPTSPGLMTIESNVTVRFSAGR
jgi:uncharacterized protein